MSSPRYVRSSYFGHPLDDGEEDVDDAESNTTDEDSDLLSYHLQALTKARFVKADVVHFI